jgi:ABC-type multidrug transport system fused ATPase/permease subunit
VGHLEVLGNITNLRWYLVAVCFFALVGTFQQAPLAVLATAFAFFATTSDPLAFAWLPLALWRALGQRGWARLPGLAALLGIVLHLVNLQPGARGERGTAADLITHPLDTIAQLLVRGPVAAQYGMNWTQEFLRFGVVPTLLTLVFPMTIAWIAWRNRGKVPEAARLAVVLVIAGEALLLIVLSFPASYIAFTEIWSPSQPSRYSAFVALFLTPALVLAISIIWRASTNRWQRAASALTAMVLVGAFISDGRGDPRHSSGPTWAQTLVESRTSCADEGLTVEAVNVPEYEGWRTVLQCGWVQVS